MATISSVGVGSGLPLDELLSNLRRSENQALASIESRATKERSRLSAYGSLKSGLEDLKTMAATLAKPETFRALKSSVNGDGFTASTETGAIAGQYRIQVTQLATSQSLKSSVGQASRDTALASGDVTLNIELVDGTTTSITVAAGDTSLEGIVEAINGNSSAGVGATLVNSGEAGTPHYLLLNATGTGQEAAVKSITVAGVDAGTDVSAVEAAIGFDQVGGGALAETAAKNATLTINGIAITAQSNTVEDAIEGVTLNLAKETTSEETLSITADPSFTRKAISTFITTYNSLQEKITSLTKYDVENQQAAALTGDSLARRVQTQMRDALTTIVASGTFRSLGEMGISVNPDTGRMAIDDATLDAALKDNMVDVKAIFTGENGIATRVSNAADTYVKSGGLFSVTTDSINVTLERLEEQYEATSTRIESRMSMYQKQFTQLDALVSQMNSTSAYLTQQLSMLESLSKGGKE